MPFTVNVGPYVGGQLWAQGLQNAGNNISEGILKAVQESKKAEEEQGADQIILNFAKQNGMVTPDMEAEYMKGSQSKKNGIIVGLTRQFAMTQQQKQADALEEQRQSMAEERKQRAAILKTQQENALLASEPPPDEERWKAQAGGYDYLFNPTTQRYELTPLQGGSGSTGKPSDKVTMTIQTPDGPKQVSVTGNYYAKVMTNPVDFKKTYSVTPTEFSDPTKTQVGVIDPNTGQFTAQAGGDYIRYNIHKDKDGTEVDSGHIPIEEWNRVKQHASQASEAIAPKTETANPTATPPRGEVKASGRVKVTKDGKVFTLPADQLDEAIKQGYKQL